MRPEKPMWPEHEGDLAREPAGNATAGAAGEAGAKGGPAAGQAGGLAGAGTARSDAAGGVQGPADRVDPAGPAEPTEGLPPRQRPKLAVRAEVLPALSLLSMVGLAGIPLGALWALLAPAERLTVAPGGELAPIPLESWNRFDALVIFALLGVGAGVVLGAGTWLLRRRRGPVTAVAVITGSLLAALLAALLGPAIAGVLHDTAGSPGVGEVVTAPPRLDSMWVVVVPPFVTAFVYGLLAAWHKDDNLGRWLG